MSIIQSGIFTAYGALYQEVSAQAQAIQEQYGGLLFRAAGNSNASLNFLSPHLTIVGSTDRLGTRPNTRPVVPANIHATIYEVLGIDPKLHLLDPSGRPVPGIPSWDG